MTKHRMYDLIGIGIGPFNLGLAALIEEQPTLTSIFFDKEEGFNWHPGMLIEQSDLQVPFIADLVTFADPTNKYSFLNYVHKQNRLFQFFFYRRFDIPRREYNLYAKWVSANLMNCQFQSEVVAVSYKGDMYEVRVRETATKKVSTYFAKHIVVGTGSVPFIPDNIEKSEHVVHTSNYLHAAKDIKASSSIIVVGSGQSAAEVFYELLEDQKHHKYSLTWYTRSPIFSQLESAKLGQEVFSPDYVHYFHGLSYEKRKEALERLDSVRNGVDKETLMKIYDLLYNRSVEGRDKKITIQPLTEMNSVKVENNCLSVSCKQWEKEKKFTVQAEKVVLATGYKPHIPEWIWSNKDDIVWESEKEFKVDEKFRLVWKEERQNQMYISTNLEHSHGTAATNLSLAVMRNQTIINDVAGREVYPIQKDTIFQQLMPDA
ncbi:lysine N(6)-hydroxylase/L-ornithine N(5)-oxygenase family protein [Sutcliffiella horikoshii]|uniref:lysine N(6)-hydroxylase/L-ornithine N(5)-oxygenase family protein n=1 Tax=Sutcliffiella horikoshii TaxID=79883 RepID=UPI001F30EAC2|nr:SidA/IucD/PvdA family monooxygenase [Sutcliffiella horikoshii]MCG1022666.1 ornithine monooxygenase [Sutcliffiella horikoshii]